jgi:hypothetical protein
MQQAASDPSGDGEKVQRSFNVGLGVNAEWQRHRQSLRLRPGERVAIEIVAQGRDAVSDVLGAAVDHLRGASVISTVLPPHPSSSDGELDQTRSRRPAVLRHDADGVVIARLTPPDEAGFARR